MVDCGELAILSLDKMLFAWFSGLNGAFLSCVCSNGLIYVPYIGVDKIVKKEQMAILVVNALVINSLMSACCTKG